MENLNSTWKTFCLIENYQTIYHYQIAFCLLKSIYRQDYIKTLKNQRFHQYRAI